MRELECKRHKLKHDAEEKEKEFQRRRIEQHEHNKYEVKKEVAKHSGLANFLKALAILYAVLVTLFLVLDASDTIPQKRQDKKNEQLEIKIVALIEEGKYDEAIAEVSNITGGDPERDWFEKKHFLIRKANAARFQNSAQTEVAIDLSSNDFKQMSDWDAITYLENLGFFDIESVKVGDNGLFTSSKIESISINNNSAFDNNTVFPLDARVMITYID